MAEQDLPQIYLITPGEIALSSFPDVLASVLDNVEVACLRMALISTDEDWQLKAGDALREVAHKRDVPLVIEKHMRLAERLGLDGVHLTDGARSVRAARKALGSDAIVGAYCENSRHEGLNAGEAGADYVAFGPVSETALGGERIADSDLFTWWSEMIEVPVIAEGGLDADRIRTLAAATDFFGIGDEIWSAENPALALSKLSNAMGR